MTHSSVCTHFGQYNSTPSSRHSGSHSAFKDAQRRSQQLDVISEPKRAHKCTVHCTLYTLCTVHAVHCTRCILYTLYTVHTVHCTRCTLYTLYTVHTVHAVHLMHVAVFKAAYCKRWIHRNVAEHFDVSILFSAPSGRRQREWPKHLGNKWCVCVCVCACVCVSGGVDTTCRSHSLHCNNLKTPYILEIVEFNFKFKIRERTG